jgi:hypothetical protein
MGNQTMRNQTIRQSIVVLLMGMLLAACSPAPESTAPAASAPQDEAQAALTAKEAQAIAKDAYIFNYSMVMMYRTMYIQSIDTTSKSYSGGFGKWLHLGTTTPKDTDIVAPNVDSPYSYAWVDTRAEPWVLTLPKIEKNRFYTSQWDDLWSFVVGNAGSVDDGNDGGDFLLASPTWKGTLPKGIKKVIQGDSAILGSLTRTQLIDSKDLANVKKVQQGYKLQPLSTYLGTPAPAPAPAVDWMAWKDGAEKTDAFWAYTNFLLPLTTPNPQDKPVLDRMAKIGLAAGKPWDSSAMGKDVQAAIAAGLKDGMDELAKGTTTFKDPALFFRTRKDTNKDYYNRALGAMVGIFGNWGRISTYFAVPKDDKGVLLDGSKYSYTLTFTKDQVPVVKNFWSWTMYKLPQRWLVDNSINRYSFGSATPGLKKAADGSITIYFSAKSPGKDKESNWLPAPNGPFWPVLRTYGPGKDILDKTWKMPPVKRVD